MDVLRIFLVIGLIAHKLVWEILKKRKQPTKAQQVSSGGLKKRMVKLGKILFLLFLVVQTLFLDLFPISDRMIFLKIIGVVIYLIGLNTAIIGRLQLGDNWVDLEDYQVLQGQSVVSKGIYRYLRHPIYTGDLLLLIGLELAINSWLVLGILLLIPIIIRQVLLEESLLLSKLPGYEKYFESTKRFIPYVV